MDASQLVKVYIKIRDAKAERTKAMEDEIAALDAQMQVIETELLEMCKSTGQDGGKTQFGSFRRSVKTRYWTSDWDSMYRFIKEHDMPELLERRVSQTTFKEFLQENPDKMPEGMNVESRYAITVTRAR
jgi:predicted metal-dependent phosphotriesterase family hydrolase